MVQKLGSHVVVVFARPDRWVQEGPTPPVELHYKEPDWDDDAKRVGEDKGDSLLGVLNEGRVQVHVILWSIIMVENCVDILQVDQSGVFIELWRLWIWLMEAASTASG